MSYKFKSLDVDNVYNTQYESVIIYQICGIPHTVESDMYNVRKILVTEENILNVVGHLTISKDKLTKLLNEIPENRYKIFPVKNFGDLSMPSNTDITLARSYILTNVSEMSGYAPFK